MTTFPITERQFNDWLARVAAVEPGRTFRVQCVVSCLVAEAVHELTGFKQASFDELNWFVRSDCDWKARPTAPWARKVIEWFDVAYEHGREVAAADLWPAYCDEFGIAPPPIEAAPAPATEAAR